GSPAHLAVAREVAERSITLARDRDGLLPLDPAKTPRVLSIIYTDATEPFAGRILQAAVRARFPGARTVHLTEGASPAAYDSLLAAAADVDLVLVSSFVRIASGKGRVGLPRDAAAFVNGLALRRPTVVASFGDPYLLRQLPAVGTYLLAWGPGAAEQVAAMRALLGEAPITGRLPITIEAGALGSVGSGGEVDPALRLVRPEEVGMDPAGLERVDQILEAAVRDGAVPGAALAVGRRGRLVRLRGYGRLDPRPGSAPATESTIYDVASLTKVVGTTTAVMILDEEGRIALDAPVSRYLPEWRGGGKDGVTVRHLLTHTSGLPAFSPLWRELEGKDAYIR